jgi:hypothetical protein
MGGPLRDGVFVDRPACAATERTRDTAAHPEGRSGRVHQCIGTLIGDVAFDHRNSIWCRLPLLQYTSQERWERSLQRCVRNGLLVIEWGTVQLSGPEQERDVTVPEEPTLEVELERLTDSETGEQRYGPEYEICWSE